MNLKPTVCSYISETLYGHQWL